MAGVRRRGRRPTAEDDDDTVSELTDVTEIDATESTDTSTAVRSTTNGSTDTSPKKSINEIIEAENSTASSTALAGVVLGIFFLYLGINTQIPVRDVAHAVVIDAGSTGTRAQVFSFKNGLLFNTEMVSSNNRIVGLGYGAPAGEFFKPLLEKVRTAVPGTKRRRSVPLALRATAGLRQTGIEVAENALKEARKALNTSGFLVKPEWISLLDEQSEATGAWATTNFLLGHLNGSVPKSSAVVELGGASLQIVFEGDENSIAAVEEEQKLAGNTRNVQQMLPRLVSGRWGGKNRQLVTITRSGFGIKEFLKKLYLIFDQEGVLEEGCPCFRKGKKLENKVIVFGLPGSEEERVTSIQGDGDFDRCVASAEIALMQYGKLPENILTKIQGDIVAFAFLYDLTVKLGLSESPSQDELISLGKRLCEGNGEIAEDRDEACAEYSYVYLLLREVTGGFRSGVNLRLTQYVDGHLLGWALGSVLTDFSNELISQLAK